MSDNGWPLESFNTLATRSAIWMAAAAEIPNERQIIQWPVEGDDAARIVRLTELCGDVAAAIARGHTDVAGELTKLLAATTIWLESLSQR
jgi:hypothetical protein